MQFFKNLPGFFEFGVKDAPKAEDVITGLKNLKLDDPVEINETNRLIKFLSHKPWYDKKFSNDYFSFNIYVEGDTDRMWDDYGINTDYSISHPNLWYDADSLIEKWGVKVHSYECENYNKFKNKIHKYVFVFAK